MTSAPKRKKKSTEPVPVPTFDDIATGFRTYTAGTAQIFASLKDCEFKIQGTDSLLVTGEGMEYFFPKKNKWPLSQLLKILKIQGGYFKRCSDELKLRSMSEFLPKCVPETPEDKGTGEVLLKFREADGRRTLRGVVDYTHVDVPNVQIMESVDALRDPSWEIMEAQGYGLDSDSTFLRILTGVPFTVGELTLRHGFDVTFSELGGARLTVTPILVEPSTSAVFGLTVAFSPLFARDYNGVTSEEFQTAIENVLAIQSKIEIQAKNVLPSSLEEKVCEPESVRKDVLLELESLKDVKGVPKAVVKTVAADLNSIDSRWKLARTLSILSQAKPFLVKQRLEAAASELLGLELVTIVGAPDEE